MLTANDKRFLMDLVYAAVGESLELQNLRLGLDREEAESAEWQRRVLAEYAVEVRSHRTKMLDEMEGK